MKIEEKVDEGALESGAGSGEEDVTAATDLGGTLQIKEPKSCSDRHMVLGTHRGGFTPVAGSHIRLRIPSFGESRSGKVWHLKQEIALFGVEFRGKATELLHLVGEALHLCLEFGGIFS